VCLMVVAVCAVGMWASKAHGNQLVVDMGYGYVIWDTATGIYDGAYAQKEMAMERYFSMLEEDPKRGWVLVEIIYPEHYKLRDERFHAIVKRDQL
jgi:hypothetical protein